uniref:Putative bovine pancreatic trypsin inhibitor n=1 Tax=Rhipicephalus microplus TaxID=6941 RepID=A0A6G5A744_RHIMP
MFCTLHQLKVRAAAQGCFRMPSEGDDCDTQTDRWYYNKDELTCLNFMYGDCPQPGNNFASVQECENACKGAGKGPPQVPLPPSRPPQKGGTKPPKGKWPPGGGGQPQKPWRPSGRPVRPPKKRPSSKGPEEKMRPWRNDLEGVDGHGRDHVRDLVRQSHLRNIQEGEAARQD